MKIQAEIMQYEKHCSDKIKASWQSEIHMYWSKLAAKPIYSFSTNRVGRCKELGFILGHLQEQ